MKTDFSKKVISLIKKIPKGKVATYSQIAKLAGNPQGTRGVVWILHSSSATEDLPWYRVINAKGRISFPEMSPSWIKQKSQLEKEGIVFSSIGKIDLIEFQWSKSK